MREKMTVLDLFSGIGGFSLGLERAGMETIAFCEIEEHARKILRKHWPEIPIYEDIKKLDGRQFRGSVDVVCGGFPCQDLSNAGHQVGFSGERSSLYREMLRIISECLPRYAIFENVTGLFTGYQGRWFGQFLYDLAEIGYDAEWHCISAAYLGAVHHRDRVWIIAYPKDGNDGAHNAEQVERQEQEPREGIGRDGIPTNPNSKRACNLRNRGKDGNEQRNSEEAERGRHELNDGSNRDSKTQILANANGKRCERFAKIAHYLKQQTEFMRSSQAHRERFTLTEPALRRTDDGVPRRVDRLRLARLGNAVVPHIPEAIGRAIIAAELNH